MEELPDLNTFGVFLAENPDGSGERLEIQRALSFDDSDHDLGMDTYCVCRSTGETHYGGVVSYGVEDRLLRIVVDEAAAAELGIAEGFLLKLERPQQQIETILSGLRTALGF